MTRARAFTAIVLASVLGWPLPAAAEPAAGGAVRIEVDVSALPKDRYTDDTRRWVLRSQTAVLEGAGFVVGDDASKAIRIEISRYGEHGMHTKATLMVVGDAGSVRELVCEACTDSQFLARVDEETAALVERLRSEPEPEPARTTVPEPEAAGTEEVEPREAEAPAQAPSWDEPDGGAARIGAAGYAGIGALATGLGITLGGVIVLGSDPSVRLQPRNDDVEEVVDRTPLGAGLTGVGAALLVAGSVLVAVDQTVLRKRRARRARAALVPVVSPMGAGLSWSGRF